MTKIGQNKHTKNGYAELMAQRNGTAEKKPKNLTEKKKMDKVAAAKQKAKADADKALKENFGKRKAEIRERLNSDLYKGEKGVAKADKIAEKRIAENAEKAKLQNHLEQRKAEIRERLNGDLYKGKRGVVEADKIAEKRIAENTAKVKKGKLFGKLKKAGKVGAIVAGAVAIGAGIWALIGGGKDEKAVPATETKPTTPAKPTQPKEPAKPTQPKEPAKPKEPTTVTVNKGDSYWKIAERNLKAKHKDDKNYKPSIKEINDEMYRLLELNNTKVKKDGLPDPMIHQGDKIKILA